MPDAKDLHNFSLSYGAHLLHGFQPHFLHPHLNPAVSSANSSSPFSGGGAFVKPFPSSLPLSSAFAPPKCLGFGLDQVCIMSKKFCWGLASLIALLISYRVSCSVEVSHIVLIPQVPHARHSRPRQKMNLWKDTQVRMVIAIAYVVRPAVVPERHQDLDVSAHKLSYSYFVFQNVCVFEQ